MKKLCSLLYRELRINRRYYLLSALMPIIISALACFALYSYKETADFTETIVTLASLMVLITAVFSFAVENVHEQDIKSGWLKYSYSLPVSAHERACAVLLKFFSAVAASSALGMILVCLIHSFCGVKFGVSYAAFLAVIIDIMLVVQTVSGFFIYRSKTAEEIKKNSNYGGFLSMLIVVGAMFALLKKCGIDFSSLGANNGGAPQMNTNFLSMINNKVLLWAAPLLIVLSVCYYFSVKVAVQNAFGASAASHKNKSAAKADKKNFDITAPHSEPIGFLYKELRENRATIIAVIGVPLFALLFMTLVYTVYCLTGSSERSISALPDILTSTLSRLLMILLGFLASGALMLGIFGGGDKRLHGYYILSLPDGAKKQVYTKYVLHFAMCGIYFVSSVFTECFIGTLRWFIVGEEMMSLTAIHVGIFFFMLLGNSFRFPVMIRYGKKRGGIIFILLLLCLGAVAIVIFALLPEKIIHIITDWIMEFLKSGSIGDVMTLVMSITQFVCVGAYILSYKISLKLFKKGVEDYGG